MASMASNQPSPSPSIPMDLSLSLSHPAPSSPSQKPFPFFALPTELRLHIYSLLLSLPTTIDLDPANHHLISPRLHLFLVSHRVHAEASRTFYQLNAFRLFPLHPRFFHTRHPLLSRLPPSYRAHLHTVELRLGPGWTNPPKCWAITERLGLRDCVALRTLKIFVECDPASDEVFRGFRRGGDFYTRFCRQLVHGVRCQVPSLRVVVFDAYPAVKRDAPLVRALVEEVEEGGLRVVWGTTWKEGEGEVERLEEALAGLRL